MSLLGKYAMSSPSTDSKRKRQASTLEVVNISSNPSDQVFPTEIFPMQLTDTGSLKSFLLNSVSEGKAHSRRVRLSHEPLLLPLLQIGS
jgi:hypothetical protein